MRSVIWREIKDRKWSLLCYCIGSLILIWLYVATFESSQQSAAQLQELVKSYPKGLVDAFGLDSLSLDTIEKYLNAKHFSLLWPLLAIIIALSRSAGQFAGEIQAGTMGLLLSSPLKRWQIFAAKYSAGLITIGIFTAASVFGVAPIAAVYGIPFHVGILVSAWLLTTLFMWSVYSIGLAVSTSVSEKGKVYAITCGALVASYTTYILSLISNQFSGLKYWSLFHYFDTQKALATGHISTQTFAVFGTIIVLGSIFAVWNFNKRDINV